MLNLSLEDRDICCKIILQEYSIDEEIRSFIKEPILKYANSNLSEQTLENMVNKKGSVFNNINSFKTNVNIFSGYIYEFLCMYDYNMYRNKDNILTILNPDSSSKTDLLHIIDTQNGPIVVPGGDVKSGSPNYVLNQYEKLLKEKYDIPFIDYSGYLTRDKHLLSKKQRNRLEKLYKEYPNKRPIEPSFSSEDINKVKIDILAYFETGYLPSERESHNIKFENEPYVKDRESREMLVRLAISRKRESESVNWSDLRKQNNINWSWFDQDQKKLNGIDSANKNEEPSESWESLENYEKQNKIDIQRELKRFEEKRATYDFKNVPPEQNFIKKILKKGFNFLGKTIYDVMTYEHVAVLQERLNSRNFTQNLDEIYYEIQERKRLEREEFEEGVKERERYEEELEYENFYYDNDQYDVADRALDRERTSPSAHSVRSHTRILRDGREIPVRAHKRGGR